MRKYFAGFIALSLALMAPGSARAVVERSATYTLVANYNLAATSYTYSFFRGPDTANGNPLGEGVNPAARVTSGATSTDVTAFTASSKPFQGLVAGDLLIFPSAPTVINTGASAVNTTGYKARQERVIVTATDDNNAIVDRDILLDQDTKGYDFTWKKFKTGTETTDGWFKCSEWIGTEFLIQVTTLNATSIDYSIEGRWPNAVNNAPQQVDSGSIASSALGSNFHLYYMRLSFDECRVGLKVTGDSGTQAVWVSVTGDYEHR